MFDNWFSRRSTVRKQPAPSSPRRVFRPGIEALEDRLALDGAVTGSFLNGTWFLTGDTANNEIVVNSTGAAGAFTVANDPADLSPTTVTGVTAPTGVKRIVINFGEGNDEVQFNTNAIPITLTRGLTINGGNGDNSVTATDLTIKGNLAITNLVGNDGNRFVNLRVVETATPGTGKVTIHNGDGGADTVIRRNTAGFNSIAKTLTVTNGADSDLDTDLLIIEDTNVGGSIIGNIGGGDGNFVFSNSFNTTTRAVIGGSVSVIFPEGGLSEIADAVVNGNVKIISLGGIGHYTKIDALKTALPVVIKGKLTIAASGDGYQVLVGTFVEQGMKVRKSVTIILNGASPTVRLRSDVAVTIGGALTIDTVTAPTLDFFGLFVAGPTRII